MFHFIASAYSGPGGRRLPAFDAQKDYAKLKGWIISFTKYFVKILYALKGSVKQLQEYHGIIEEQKQGMQANRHQYLTTLLHQKF